MTIEALISDAINAERNCGVESDSQVKIRMPDGKEYEVKTTEIRKHKTPFGGWHQFVIHVK